jgi:DNA-directed RNA polymerase specialized sigma24 family protein
MTQVRDAKLTPRSNHRNDDLIACIPLLRQFCFCAIGSLGRADDLIERFLREFEAGADRLKGQTCTLGLFRAFLRNRTVRETLSKSADDKPSLDALHAEVIALPIELRQAALLVVTIGFTPEEAADILEIDADSVGRCVSAAIDRIFSSKTKGAKDLQQQAIDETVWTSPVPDPA